MSINRQELRIPEKNNAISPEQSLEKIIATGVGLEDKEPDKEKETT